MFFLRAYTITHTNLIKYFIISLHFFLSFFINYTRTLSLSNGYMSIMHFYIFIYFNLNVIKNIILPFLILKNNIKTKQKYY